MSLSSHQGTTSVGTSPAVLTVNIQEILISFRIDWFDLLAIQWTLKSLLPHHSSKASILWSSTFSITLNIPLTAPPTLPPPIRDHVSVLLV